MEVELKLDKNFKQPKIIIYSAELTDEISDLINKLKDSGYKKFIGTLDEKKFLINRDEIESFYAETNKVYARVDEKRYIINNKLYELEKMLEGTSFVRISNSEIVNFNKVDSLEINSYSTIFLKFKSGSNTYVSRRYIPKIKKIFEFIEGESDIYENFKETFKRC